MNRKLITVVLWVIGSVGGCAALGTQTGHAYNLIENLAKPTVDALMDATSSFAQGQRPF